MGIIQENSFKKARILQKSKELKYDPILIEKVVYVFELLAALIDSGLNFIFKGGTSLLLLLPEQFKRLSIDLDIVVPQKISDFADLFNEILNETPFIRWEEDIRDEEENTPLKHFKFYYRSSINDREEPLLLDIFHLKNLPYTEIIKRRIDSSLFAVRKKTEVKVLSPENLFADKLTAFAPNTIGIRYEQDKSTEIIKQLFDLGVLFWHIKRVEKIKIAYENMAKIESDFRNIKKPISSFLEDSFDAAFLISQLDFKGGVSNKKTEELKNGIKRFRSFVSEGKYNLLNAKEDASKVAFVSFVLKTNLNINLENIQGTLKNFDKANINDLILKDRFKILNKFKNLSPPSFYLWTLINGI